MTCGNTPPRTDLGQAMMELSSTAPVNPVGYVSPSCVVR